jgi:hypothetical protein
MNPIKIIQYGTIGDKIKEWGYAVVIPIESETTGISMYNEVSILDGHWVMKEYIINSVNNPLALFPTEIKKIRPINKLDEINQLAFNSAMDLATRLSAMFNDQLYNNSIFNKTQMRYQEVQ